MPTTVRGVWLYLYLMVDVWIRKVVAWDVAEVESADIAAELAQQACLKGRYHKPTGFGSHQCQQPLLIFHADNGNALAADFSKNCEGATLESWLEEVGVLRSFSRPRVCNDNTYSESLVRTMKYRPGYPSRPFGSEGDACKWVAAFVNWYNHLHRHSGIKFITPHQRHSGATKVIYQQRTDVYETARRVNPTRWNRSTRCWRQLEEVWINKPPEDPEQIQVLPLIQAS